MRVVFPIRIFYNYGSKFYVFYEKVSHLHRAVRPDAKHSGSVQLHGRQIVTETFLSLYSTLSFGQIHKSFLSLGKDNFFSYLWLRLRYFTSAKCK